MDVTDELRRDLRALVLKHGTHDQSSHGNWATGRGGGSSDSGQGSPRSSHLITARRKLRREMKAKTAERRKEIEEAFFSASHKELRDRFSSMSADEVKALRRSLYEEKAFISGGRVKGKPLTAEQRIGKFFLS